MEHHAERGIYPPVHVQVALGTEDLTVKVKSYICCFLSLAND